MKRWTLTLFIAFSLVWAACLRTDGFSPNLIAGPLATEQSPLLTPEIQSILSQPFHYLSKGRQCFVFESADGKYVLKFFNQKYLRMPWYAFFNEKKERSKRALRRSFYEHSYEIAYRELGEEILYLHLGPSASIPALTLSDKSKRTHTIDVTQIPFILQKRGTPFYEGLKAVYQKEGASGLQREIDAYLAAISLRISKNIADADTDVENNWGYVDGQIFHLDPGRLYYEDLSDPRKLQTEWHRATHNFYKWLKVHYPDAAQYLPNR